MNGLEPTLKPQPQTELTVGSIDKSVGSRRAQLERLIDGRNRKQEELSRARQELVALKTRIKELNAYVAKANRSIFVLSPELERLLALQQKVRDRGLQIVERIKRTPPAHTVRRAYPRRHVRVDVSMVSESNFYLGFSEDVSEGGIFVATHGGIRKIGERFPLVFTLPTRSEPIFCLAEVAWVREYRDGQDPRHGSPGMGLRFVALSSGDREAIAAFTAQRDPLFHPEADDLEP
jgi:uncharacterized protein (TIGR02266 family)